MIIEQTIAFSADHPALEGHFPGDPIVPGAVLLDEAACLARDRGGRRVIGVRTAKFKTPLRPGTHCTFRLERRDDGAFDLTCRAGQTMVLAAILDCVASDEPS
jgi:3-hydroxymyristoyl/3-hydroxydecanoyl-(acyl carrier protein) dehydratase